MILHFRTERNASGNCKYLGIDTKEECYATESNRWIDKEYPVLKVKDYRYIIELLDHNNFKRIERI